MDRSRSLKLTRVEVNSYFDGSAWAAQYPPILDVEQAAKLLCVPKATIYEWSSRKLLRRCSRRVGKRLLLVRDRLIMHIFNEGIQAHDTFE